MNYRKVTGTTVSLPKGDSVYIKFNVKETGECLDLPHDVELQVRDENGDLMFAGDLTEHADHSLTWHIRPDQTADLEVDSTYFWDVEWCFYEDGSLIDRITPIYGKLKIRKEVTNHE